MNATKTRAEVLNIIQKISTADSEDSVRLMTRLAVRKAGAEHFIYSTFRLSDSGHEFGSHHYFEDCKAEWRSIYEERKWYMNDPLIEYAKLHTEPTLSSKIIPITRGQSDMMAAAACHGFRSGIIIPAHSRFGSHDCLSILFIGSSSEPACMEQHFLSNRITFRALAMELMDWWRNHFRAVAIQKFKIKEFELCVLEHLSNGKTVAEIAAILETRPSTLYHRLAILKDKLCAVNTGDTVHQAKANGLLG